jgi:hypothetical protein
MHKFGNTVVVTSEPKIETAVKEVEVLLLLSL